MSFFVMPYRVLFHDTMAYGSHHFLTNFKFQCEAREQMFFDAVSTSPEAQAALAGTILLTQQAYSRNLAPVAVGEKVAILLSAEEPTLSSVRFCFRVIRHDGAPVSCGFQTLVCISKDTKEVVAAPPVVVRGYPRIQEKLRSPSFGERVLAGRLKHIFDDETVAIGMEIANARPEQSFPRFIDRSPDRGGKYRTQDDLPTLRRGLIFMLPGQGSYAPWLLRRLRDVSPGAPEVFRRADEVTRDLLGCAFLPLVEAATDAEHSKMAGDDPELVQVGVFLGSVLSARFLIEQGLEPDLVTGHSAGELAALVIAGACDLELGIELVCRRVRALRRVSGVGGMLALSTDDGRVRAFIDALRPCSLDVAVVNYGGQTIASGTDADVRRLQALAEHLGVGSARIQSSYPFHSRLMEPAVSPFADAIQGYPFRPPRIPVYSPIERGIYSEPRDLPRLLASHLVRPFAFPDAIRRMQAMGARMFVECGASRVLGMFVRKILHDAPDVRIWTPFADQKRAGEEVRQLLVECGAVGLCQAPDRRDPWPSSGHVKPSTTQGDDTEVPIAIVSLGCILPGARNPDEFWSNILRRWSGLSDAGDIVPELASSFKSTGDVVPDKTYTLLGGFARGTNPNIDGLPYDTAEFAQLTWSQRFLAVATSQCLAGLTSGPPKPQETHVFVGSTADGSAEYDEALLVVGLQQIVGRLDATAQQRTSLQQILEKALGRTAAELSTVAPYPAHLAVAERLVGSGVKVVAVDAACASSLYAIDLGIKALRSGECKVALCGGVFAPGPANSCLFSQFRGLSATGSRPFDIAADGVVFGEGAAFLALKCLPDAIAAGDRVRAVIRGTGLSNDGKSPSVAVPKKSGQVLALRRAYERTGIDPSTVQYVEAHATATPVGDAVELSALNDVFSQHGAPAPRIELGSVKALIGHTGWVAGAASVIKMIKALEARVIPPQANFEAPSRNVDLERSPFVISTIARAWPRNGGGEPRRAGINSFGFGGSNAHLILEEFEPRYHSSRWPRARNAIEARFPVVAVVGVGALFPNPDSDRTRGGLRFDRSALHLPKGVRILPDAADHMDAGQVLAVMASHAAVESLTAGATTGRPIEALQPHTAVVLGVEGKTGRGIEADQRIYLDFVARRIAGLVGDRTDLDAVRDQLFAVVRGIMPSNPYTLPGLMPNVIAGRVANVFNLGGSNMVVDVGGESLRESLCLAAKMLGRGECELVLAGGVNGFAGIEAELAAREGARRQIGEAALILMLVRPETARERGFRVMAELDCSPGDVDESSASTIRVGADVSSPYLTGAHGAREVVEAIRAAERGEGHRLVRWSGGSGIRVSASASATPVRSYAGASAGPEGHQPVPDPSTIDFCRPRLVRDPLGQPTRAFTLSSARLLLLVDERSSTASAAETLRAQGCTVVCPATVSIPGAVQLDLSSESALVESLRRLDLDSYDALVAVKDLSSAGGMEPVLAEAQGGGLLDLLFAVARHAYERLKAGRAVLATLCIGASIPERLPPYTGLFAGFIKGLARELPQGVCKALTTDEYDLSRAMGQLEVEFQQGGLPAAPEVVYGQGTRYAFRLERLNKVTRSNRPWLTPDSVVLASGGARGVTAALVEEVLRRFGCKVVLMGRSDPGQVSPAILAMDADAFEQHEAAFYREELARRPEAKLAELKRRWATLSAAREVTETLAHLREFPGHVEYVCADVTDATAVDAVVRDVSLRFGRIDLVVHGAGTQVSKALSKKKLGEFRGIVATKVAGLGNLHRACRAHLPRHAVRFHLLASAFSYFGNDGQPDYGAANEAMNRIAASMDVAQDDAHWTALGWLGWAGIGMTRGSEYAALARARGLRPVTREEGQAIFSMLLDGEPVTPVNILVSAGEINFFRLQVDDDPGRAQGHALPQRSRSPHALPQRIELHWDLSLGTHPYLSDHLVRGRPVLPASFEAELAARAARALRGDHQAIALEGARLESFVRIPATGAIRLRGRAAVMDENAEETVVLVHLLSDFVHKSGRVLRSDILHFETRVRLTKVARELDPMDKHGSKRSGRPVTVSDPYLSPQAPVRLGGFFRCLDAIEIADGVRHARFRIGEDEKLHLLSDFLTPAVLGDGLFRFSMIQLPESGSIPIHIPVRCGRILMAPGINDALLHAKGENLLLASAIPRSDDQLIHSDWAQVTDRHGRVLMTAEALVAKRFGEVPHDA